MRQLCDGWTITSSPGATWPTSLPTSSTMPAASLPETWGKMTAWPGMPRRAQMSL